MDTSVNAADQVVSVGFFFQAEDGIRYLTVTGVQTCALPISVCQPCNARRQPHPDFLPGDFLRSTQASARLSDVRRQLPQRREAPEQIGRAACRGRVEILGVAVSLKKKKKVVSVCADIVFYDC